MDIGLIFIYGLIVLFAFFLLWWEGLLDNNKRLAIAVIALAVAFAVRASMLDYRSGDYNTFLVRWVDYYRQNGGFAALKDSLGNYNFPYMYFLSLFSYSHWSDLYLIKFLSILFDVILAFAMMKMAGVFTSSKSKRLWAYLITLLLPTVIINGAKWGQCDSIYVAFALLALWLVLADRPKLAMVCITLSFSFKLQAVFILPVFLVMLFAKKIKFRDYFIFPITYVIIVLPAVIAGRPFKDAILLYYNQATSAGQSLNLNSPSIFSLVRGEVNTPALSAAGIAIAFLFVFLIFFWTYRKRKSLNNEVLLFVSLLFAVGIPLFLPHMHDRYFFMADVLTLMPAILYPAFAPVTILTSLASYLCYYSYLNQTYLLPIQYGTIALIGVLFILVINTSYLLSSRRYSRLN